MAVDYEDPNVEQGWIITSGLWGFLVGFVGWGSIGRLPALVSRWLISDDETPAVLTARVFVMVFLLFAIMLALTLVPALEIAAAQYGKRLVPPWRDAFGVAFVASWAGFAVTGLLRRWAKASKE